LRSLYLPIGQGRFRVDSQRLLIGRNCEHGAIDISAVTAMNPRPFVVADSLEARGPAGDRGIKPSVISDIEGGRAEIEVIARRNTGDPDRSTCQLAVRPVQFPGMSAACSGCPVTINGSAKTAYRNTLGFIGMRLPC
jgi:hypothetical protein